jgi:hypothetical protein
MANRLETTDFKCYGRVVLTAGGIVSGCGQIFGVFADEADARSQDADKLALAIVGRADMTDAQVAIAERNTESLGDD